MTGRRRWNLQTDDLPATLPDGDYIATLPAGSVLDTAGDPLAAEFNFDFFFLAGDASRDRTVNLADFNIMVANFGQTERNFSPGDFNYDGQVNLADYNILASRFGTSLGPDGIATVASGSAVLRGTRLVSMFAVRSITDDALDLLA